MISVLPVHQTMNTDSIHALVHNVNYVLSINRDTDFSVIYIPGVGINRDIDFSVIYIFLYYASL